MISLINEYQRNTRNSNAETVQWKNQNILTMDLTIAGISSLMVFITCWVTRNSSELIWESSGLKNQFYTFLLINGVQKNFWYIEPDIRKIWSHNVLILCLIWNANKCEVSDFTFVGSTLSMYICHAHHHHSHLLLSLIVAWTWGGWDLDSRQV